MQKPTRVTESGLVIKSVLSTAQTQGLAHLDAVLKTAFDLDMTHAPERSVATSTPETQRIAEFMWRVVHIARSLLQAIKLPLFELAQVQAVQPLDKKTGQFEAVCWAPTLDHVDPAVVNRCYEFALVLAQFFSVHTQGAKYKETLDTIKDKFTEPLSQKMPGGKSTVPLLTIAHEKGIPFFHLGAGIY